MDVYGKREGGKGEQWLKEEGGCIYGRKREREGGRESSGRIRKEKGEGRCRGEAEIERRK